MILELWFHYWTYFKRLEQLFTINLRFNWDLLILRWLILALCFRKMQNMNKELRPIFARIQTVWNRFWWNMTRADISENSMYNIHNDAHSEDPRASNTNWTLCIISHIHKLRSVDCYNSSWFMRMQSMPYVCVALHFIHSICQKSNKIDQTKYSMYSCNHY